MDIKEGDDKKKSATFWMWFLAVFNLTKSHLQDYWNNEYVWHISRSCIFNFMLWLFNKSNTNLSNDELSYFNFIFYKISMKWNFRQSSLYLNSRYTINSLVNTSIYFQQLCPFETNCKNLKLEASNSCTL